LNVKEAIDNMQIMGILNVTPDSFSDGGQFVDIEKAVAHAKQMVADGADIIDVGGESTRPNAEIVSIEEELSRVIPVIKRLSEEINVPISIDTYKAEVARQAVKAGATIINDVGGAKMDPEMPRVMAKSGVKVILMHNHPHGQEDGSYQIFEKVITELQESINLVLAAGVKPENIIVDPGIGFGKTPEQNIQLIQQIGE
jgi:dihydropteroate synthase